MIPPETKAILEAGNHQVFSVNPLHQDKIQRTALAAAMTEAKRGLMQRRQIHIILVKS